MLTLTAIAPATQAQAGAVIRLGDVTLVLGGDNCRDRGYRDRCSPPPCRPRYYSECPPPRRCEPQPRCNEGYGYRNNYNSNPGYYRNYRNDNDPKQMDGRYYSYGR
ncbi:MAG TPA: hypothetical protein VK970_16065 [Candidatus Methylacidiphilales bacterium]|nr:hypothetical protein [Candidatus Methylacidiphilales bacterium]